MKEYLGKNIIIVAATFILLALIFGFATLGQEKPEEISLSKLTEKINQEEIKEIVAVGSVLQIVDHEGVEFTTRKEAESSLSESLANYGVETNKLANVDVIIKEPQDLSLINFLIVALVPLIFFLIFFWYIFRQAKGGAMQSLEFTKSKAKLLGAENKDDKEKTKFDDVAGLKEVKEELQEIVDFLKNPKKFHDMGAKIPKGVLLVGPAGVGKTLLARAIAGEAGVNFFHTSGSTFVELFVGTGAARIRDLFNTAKKSSPAIIFIDELDAVGRMRGSGIGGGHDEKEQTLNQLLVEMDGFEKNSKVIVVSATNRPDILDPALLRPGRFDRLITLDNPDVKDREDVLKIHTKNKPLSSDVSLREIAERTPGFSGADLANVANEAAILAARKNKKKIYQEDFLESIEKVLLGPQRKSHILSKKEKEISAAHEVGHAITSTFLEKSSPVRKISIISRGAAAGYTIILPKEEKRIKTKSEFLSEISSLLGGYCAEKIKYGEMSSGSSNDIKKASILANKIVREYGMSSLGPIAFGKKDDNIFLGKELIERNSYSEKIASKIDDEVAMIIKKAEEKTNKILRQNKDLLDKITKILIEKETIEKEEFEDLIKKGA
jgi:cell division protease FtsH